MTLKFRLLGDGNSKTGPIVSDIAYLIKSS